MMVVKSGLSIILLFIAFVGFGHDIKMAIFEISENESGLSMMVSIDKEDFLQTLKAEFSSDFQKRELEEIAQEYLQSKLSIKVNGDCRSFQLNEIEYGDLNIYLKGSLDGPGRSITEVQITNTVMIDHVKDHDNIIRLKLNERKRSFRLNSDRISTVARYE